MSLSFKLKLLRADIALGALPDVSGCLLSPPMIKRGTPQDIVNDVRVNYALRCAVCITTGAPVLEWLGLNYFTCPIFDKYDQVTYFYDEWIDMSIPAISNPIATATSPNGCLIGVDQDYLYGVPHDSPGSYSGNNQLAIYEKRTLDIVLRGPIRYELPKYPNDIEASPFGDYIGFADYGWYECFCYSKTDLSLVYHCEWSTYPLWVGWLNPPIPHRCVFDSNNNMWLTGSGSETTEYTRWLWCVDLNGDVVFALDISEHLPDYGDNPNGDLWVDCMLYDDSLNCLLISGDSYSYDSATDVRQNLVKFDLNTNTVVGVIENIVLREDSGQQHNFKYGGINSSGNIWIGSSIDAGGIDRSVVKVNVTSMTLSIELIIEDVQPHTTISNLYAVPYGIYDPVTSRYISFVNRSSYEDFISMQLCP